MTALTYYTLAGFGLLILYLGVIAVLVDIAAKRATPDEPHLLPVIPKRQSVVLLRPLRESRSRSEDMPRQEPLAIGQGSSGGIHG